MAELEFQLNRMKEDLMSKVKDEISNLKQDIKTELDALSEKLKEVALSSSSTPRRKAKRKAAEREIQMEGSEKWLLNEYFNDFLKPRRCLIPSSSTTNTWAINKISELIDVEGYVRSHEIILNGLSAPVTAQVTCHFPSGRLNLQLSSAKDPDYPLQLAGLPPYPRVSYIVHRQDINIVYVTELLFRQQFQTDKSDWYVTHLSEEDVEKAKQADYLVLTVAIDFPHFLEPAFGHDGVLIWKPENVNKKYQKITDRIKNNYSPYFYTGPKGYCIKTDIDLCHLFGETEVKSDQPILFNLYRVTGQFDLALPQDVTLNVEVRLYHPKSKEEMLIENVKMVGTDHIKLKLLPYNQLKDFFVDDSILIGIYVKMS